MLNEGARDVLGLTAKIVAAHVGHNQVAPDALPSLIQSVYRSLATAADDQVPAPAPSGRLTPAVPVKRSVFPDHIICLEDGRKFQTLKRHLQSSYGLTPEQYRAKWGLPHNYPMVAETYANLRSKLARTHGLGRERGYEVAVRKLPARRARGI